MKIGSRDLTLTQQYALGALAFVVMEILLILLIDKPLSQYLRTVDTDHQGLIDFFRNYTDFGKSYWYLWPSGIGTIVCFFLASWRQIQLPKREKFRRAAWMLSFFFVCVALSGIVTDMIKPLIGRARPVLLDRENFYGFIPFTTKSIYNSFPSGHVTTAFAVAFALTALFPGARRWFLTFAVAIAVSRVMVNAHYLADVPAGIMVAYFTTRSVRILYLKHGRGAKKYGIFPIDNRHAGH